MKTIIIPTTQNIELEYPVANMGERIQTLEVEMRERDQQRRTALEHEYSEKRDALEAEHRARIELLETKEAEIDASSNRHARRALREKITDELKARQDKEISPESARSVRPWIIGLSGLGILAALGFAFISLDQISEAS